LPAKGSDLRRQDSLEQFVSWASHLLMKICCSLQRCPRRAKHLILTCHSHFDRDHAHETFLNRAKRLNGLTFEESEGIA